MIFPFFIINLGLERLLQIKESNSREKLNAKFDQALQIVANFSNNEYFAHLLLLNLYLQADRAKDPIAAIRIAKNKLQQRYPNSFQFIVWDKNGSTVKDLTDESSFAYMIRRTYGFLKEASSVFSPDSENKSPPTLKYFSNAEKELKILRNFLGKMLVPFQLHYPWLSGKLGRPLQVAPPGPRSRIWYRVNEKFGFLCFINDNFIQSHAGMDFALKKLKSEFPGFNANISNYPASEKFYPEVDQQLASRLILALSKFENLSPSKTETIDQLIIGCQIINPLQRAVCYCPVNLAFSWTEARNFYVAKAAKFLFISLFLFYVWYKTRGIRFLSIRYKLIILFLYAGGMPVIIMGSIGYDYLKQKREEMVFHAQAQGINILRHFDKSFFISLADHSSRLKHFLRQVNLQYGLDVLKPESIARIRKEIFSRLEPESIQLFNENGQNLVQDSEKTIFSDYTLTGQIALGVFRLLNSPGENILQATDPLTKSVAIEAMTHRREISYIGLGAEELYRFYEFLGETDNFKNIGMLQLYWRPEKLQQRFIEYSLHEWKDDLKQEKILLKAYYPDEDKLFPETGVQESLKQHGQQAFDSLILRQDSISIDSKEFTMVAMKGLNLDRITMIFLKPLDQIENEILNLQKSMAGFVMLVLIMTVMMFKIFTSHFLEPINGIKSALKAINTRDFSFRLDVVANNEFSELGKTFNATLENLKELETATIVQANLLPSTSLSLNRAQLLACSRPFSRLGGDYFDYFSPDQKNLLVFIGDVSGHGISAALIMAMAKAAIICEKNNFTTFEQLVLELNQVLCHNRKSGNKEYMTALTVCLNSETGSLSLINTGHCMPFIVSADGSAINQIHCVGLPLGYDENRMFSKFDLTLQSGETLVLYTDGFVETFNSDEKQLGYDQFSLMIKDSWNDNLEEFQKNLLRLNNNASFPQNDDQTIIFLRLNS